MKSIYEEGIATCRSGIIGIRKRVENRKPYGVEVRNAYYHEYLRTEAIEIEGVVEVLAELSKYVRLAIVTTAKRADFQLMHEKPGCYHYLRELGRRRPPDSDARIGN